MRYGSRTFTVAFGFAMGLASAWAQIEDEPALSQGPAHEEIVSMLAHGPRELTRVRRLGLEVFTTPFNTFDGRGDGPFRGELPTVLPGNRPTLHGNGQLLRMNGLDAQSCNDCHSVISHLTRPPTLGIGGVGGMAQNAIIMPTMIDVADSEDDRVAFAPGHDPDMKMLPDGIADFNGRRVSNPPFLFGGGGVELLAKEMTADLQALLARARDAAAGTITQLETHGVAFGSIMSLGGGQVELAVEGIGFADNSSHSPEEVLVVRPFGRKGENFSMRDFDRGAMQFHFGLQPVEVVGEGFDEDGDGIADEVSSGEMTALHVFDVTNPLPVAEKRDEAAQRGFATFVSIGRARCHVPTMETRSRYLPLAFPEVPEDPGANVYYLVDLVRVGFEPTKSGGVRVPLFADLKRHDMGSGLEETFERATIPNAEFTTARLWGIADTAPYLHDGRATTLTEAILAHGGEAQGARDAFVALFEADRRELRAFLATLRTPRKPNEELLRGAR
ncbi:MAG TPA: di-heme oxidoredictase family protein [Vicinamibacteria bacterium]|nr:di-heme oxidoredictase family protein [Vicinamibacteria bacterium]